MANHCLKLRTILPEYTGSICTIYDVRKIPHFEVLTEHIHNGNL
ncbi:hypothetical protein NXV10_00460 [Bacteroides thetaiotaomicron]|nr:hypothetical protein [Bacteroides thetaiotaomicron]